MLEVTGKSPNSVSHEAASMEHSAVRSVPGAAVESFSTAFAFDSLGRLVAKMDQGPDASLSTNWTVCCSWPVLPPTLFSFFGFDSRSNQTLTIDAKGNTTQANFDGASRQIQTLQHLRLGGSGPNPPAGNTSFLESGRGVIRTDVVLDGNGRIMRRDARRIGFAQADERIGNVDGGPWIVNLIMNWAVVLTALCLDFYHLGDNVNKTKRIAFGEGSDAGKQWAGQLLHEARHNGYAPFWDRLVEWRGTQRRAKRKEADRLLNYVATREKMIVYDQCEKNGWRISSSTTESECGAVPHRVKGPGKRWDGDNAESVIALEAMHQSHMWPTYWETCAWQNN